MSKAPRRVRRYAHPGLPEWDEKRFNTQMMWPNEVELLHDLRGHRDPDVQAMAEQAHAGDLHALIMLHDALLDAGFEGEDIHAYVKDLIGAALHNSAPSDVRQARRSAIDQLLPSDRSEPAPGSPRHADLIKQSVPANDAIIGEFMVRQPRRKKASKKPRRRARYAVPERYGWVPQTYDLHRPQEFRSAYHEGAFDLGMPWEKFEYHPHPSEIRQRLPAGFAEAFSSQAQPTEEVQIAADYESPLNELHQFVDSGPPEAKAIYESALHGDEAAWHAVIDMAQEWGALSEVAAGKLATMLPHATGAAEVARDISNLNAPRMRPGTGGAAPATYPVPGEGHLPFRYLLDQLLDEKPWSRQSDLPPFMKKALDAAEERYDARLGRRERILKGQEEAPEEYLDYQMEPMFQLGIERHERRLAEQARQRQLNDAQQHQLAQSQTRGTPAGDIGHREVRRDQRDIDPTHRVRFPGGEVLPRRESEILDNPSPFDPEVEEPGPFHPRARMSKKRRKYALGNRPVWPADPFHPNNLYSNEEEMLRQLAETHPDVDVRGMAQQALRGDTYATVMLHDALIDAGEDPDGPAVALAASIASFAARNTVPSAARETRGLSDLTAIRGDAHADAFTFGHQRQTVGYMQHMLPAEREVLGEFMVSRPTGTQPPVPEAHSQQQQQYRKRRARSMARPAALLRSLRPYPRQMNKAPRRVSYSGIHAPAGGVVVRGIHYPGGKFIPARGPEKSSYDQWSHYAQQAAKYRRADGSFDMQAMRDEVAAKNKATSRDKPKAAKNVGRVKKSAPAGNRARWEPEYMIPDERETLLALSQNPDRDVRQMAQQALAGDSDALIMLHDALLDAGYTYDHPHLHSVLTLAGFAVRSGNLHYGPGSAGAHIRAEGARQRREFLSDAKRARPTPFRDERQAVDFGDVGGYMSLRSRKSKKGRRTRKAAQGFPVASGPFQPVDPYSGIGRQDFNMLLRRLVMSSSPDVRDLVAAAYAGDHDALIPLFDAAQEVGDIDPSDLRALGGFVLRAASMALAPEATSDQMQGQPIPIQSYVRGREEHLDDVARRRVAQGLSAGDYSDEDDLYAHLMGVSRAAGTYLHAHAPWPPQ